MSGDLPDDGPGGIANFDPIAFDGDETFPRIASKRREFAIEGPRRPSMAGRHLGQIDLEIAHQSFDDVAPQAIVT